MRPQRRPLLPGIDYRDRPRSDRRSLGSALLLGILLGAVGVLFSSVTKPEVPRDDARPRDDSAAIASESAVVSTSTVPRPLAPARGSASDTVAADYKANELKNSLARQAPSLRACYETFLQDEPDVFEGKVTIDFRIDGDGNVLSPGIVASDLDSDTFADCLVARLAGFAFPPPPDHQKTYAAHTFLFKRDAAF